MSILKCKMCGGSMEVQPGQSVAVCEYCGTMQTLPKLESERIAGLYERAELLRRSNDFDKAAAVYEQIVSAAPTDAEAYWSLVLCRYGIEYVEDPASHKRVPTINRIQYGSVLDDADYLSALQHADSEQKAVYEAEARAIEAIQKGFLAISMKEKPFDVFICYKETDNNGRRTPDSVLANDLYHQLEQEGFKVFFSRITLEDKLGAEYEPYIFAALNSSRVMVAIGTKAEYFNAPWVRNEWGRFLALIKNGEPKTLIPAYRDMNPYDLPEEFAQLQALDMSRLGFMQDLIRGIKKILGTSTATAPAAVSNHAAQLGKRALLALEDGEWKKADEFCEQALNEDAEYAMAYLGKLMVKLRVRKIEELANQKQPFDNQPLYGKVVRFGDSELVARLQGYNEAIRDREKQAAQAKQAAEAKKAEEAARLKEEKRQQQKAQKAQTKAALQKHGKKILAAVLALVLMVGAVFGGMKISESQKEKAALAAAEQAAAEEAAAQAAAEEAARLAAEEEAAQKSAEEAAQLQAEYDAAVALLQSGNYAEAVSAFEPLGDYADSAVQLKACRAELEWQSFREAIDAENPDHDAAISHLETLAELDSDRRDDGYYELVKVYYKKGLPTECAEYLAEISDPSRFEDFETLKEDVRLLDLYVQAKEISVTNNETRTQLVELLNQLPEDYRKVDEMRKAIEAYDGEATGEEAEENAEGSSKEDKKDTSAADERVYQSNGQYYLYAYDSQGRTKKAMLYDPDGTFRAGYENEFNNVGLLIRKYDLNESWERGSFEEYTHTTSGQLIKKTFYDKAGKPFRYIEYEYNASGQKIKEKWCDADGSIYETVTYEYNTLGQITKKEYKPVSGRTSTYVNEYDSSGNLIAEYMYINGKLDYETNYVTREWKSYSGGTGGKF